MKVFLFHSNEKINMFHVKLLFSWDKKLEVMIFTIVRLKKVPVLHFLSFLILSSFTNVSQKWQKKGGADSGFNDLIRIFIVQLQRRRCCRHEWQ